MRYRPFGRTGLSVSVVGFGCWPMAGDRYGAIEDDEAVKAIHRALDRGVNCVDTAPAYGGGHSEEVVGRALAGRREDVILVTKCGVKAPPPGQLGPLRDASRANILREVDASLKRLDTDWVDVLLVHWPDAGTPFEDTMRGLEEVVTSGRVRFVGVSNFTGAMMAECMRTRRIDVSQVGYHMLDRRQERETFPHCLDHGIGVMGYGSLGHGLLTGAFTASTAFDPARDWRGNGVAFGQPIFRGDNFRANVGVVERLRREVAEPRGVPLSQIALAWVLGHPAISTALVGARTPAEVDANDAGAELDLSPAERATIDSILAGAAGQVREFTPLRPAMEVWGEEIPAARPRWIAHEPLHLSMRIEPIDDPADPRVADYRDIKDAELRLRHGLFVAESRAVVRGLLASARFRTRSILLTAPALDSLREALRGRGRAHLSDEPRGRPRRRRIRLPPRLRRPGRARGRAIPRGAHGPTGPAPRPGARGRLESRQRGRRLPEREGLRRRRDPPLRGLRRSPVSEGDPHLDGRLARHTLRARARLGGRARPAAQGPATPSWRSPLTHPRSTSPASAQAGRSPRASPSSSAPRAPA